MTSPDDPITIEGRDRLACIDLTVYGMETVLAAAYALTGKCFLHLQTVDQHRLEIRLRTKRPEDDTDVCIREFFNNLIDQRLRKIVADETAKTRDLLMAHALSRVAFIRPDLEDSSPQEDPAYVSIPDRLKIPTF
ncbi:His-Xaa-Ser system protein HxsD [Geminisphaera colitermitum]|uniref:His-Xaa-Ser system protein HxsD n=1 Tax=Geminisphaera colitermitum TaxID=1148786 RepID=UPI000158D339|nr:His-Xaa-Ser system protein HxsD [Geminisphaera colitermitum]